MLDRVFHDRRLTQIDSPLEERQIRLLSVHGQTDHGSPVCRLTTFELAKAPTYQALSYVWGPPFKSMGIVCNGMPLTVTKNLYEALLACLSLNTNDLGKHKGSATSIQYIWIDALCINQEDFKEKSQQVGLMRHIFMQAERVIVWLGQDNDSARKALVQIQNMYESFANAVNFHDLETISDFTNSRITLDRSDEVTESHEEFDTLRPLVNLYSHKWFRRIWIIQETVLAR